MTTPETQAHAKEVYNFLTQNPHIHNQDAWVESNSSVNPKQWVISTEKNHCNTTMCIAGTSVYLREGVEGLAKFNTESDEKIKDAQKYLGLSDTQRSRLFYTLNNEMSLELLKALADGDVDGFNEIYFG